MSQSRLARLPAGAGNGRLIAGYQSIADQTYRVVSPRSSAAIDHRLQIYGYVASICTKVKTSSPLLASHRLRPSLLLRHSSSWQWPCQCSATQWETFIDNSCSGALAAHTDAAVFEAEQITGLLLLTIQRISWTQCPHCHAQLEPGSWTSSTSDLQDCGIQSHNVFLWKPSPSHPTI